MSNANDFVIEAGVLKKYSGPGGDIIIPGGVMKIGDHAFSGCSSLKSVTIPEGVTNIESFAFSGCRGLISVMIPESVTRIDWGAFSDCGNLTSVIIPRGVTSIESETFSRCHSLTSVTIPHGVTRIKRHAFSGCSSLTNVTIPEGVTSIESCAFSGCRGLTSVMIPESVTSIDWEAFSKCSSLTNVRIPESVTSIKSNAFSGCPNLADSNGFVIALHILFDYYGNAGNIVVPEGVTCINGGTFSGCKDLKSVTIPESVTSIGKEVFPNKHIDIHISSLAAWCRLILDGSIIDGWLSNKGGFDLYLDNRIVSDLVIPDSITEIGDHVFRQCQSLKKLTIPEQVNRIGRKSFTGCSNLESVVILSNTIHLSGWGWFYECKSLRRVEFSTTDVVFDSSDNDPFKDNFYNKEFCIILPENATYTGKKLPVQLAKACRSMSEDELAGVLLFQSSKLWRNEAFAAAGEKDPVKIIEKQLELIGKLKKLPAAAASNALECFVAFSQVLPEKYVRQFASALEERKCSKQISALREDIVLREKLQGNNADDDQTLLEKSFKIIMDANSLTQKQIEDDLKRMMGIKLEDLPELKDIDGNTCKSYVLAWLLTTHGTGDFWGKRRIREPDWTEPGIKPEAEQIVALIKPESLQAAIMTLADKYLVKYQNQQKKFLSYPVCRYANETSMAELTRRAPKWATCVSGNDAPPLRYFRDAAKYSNTRSAMLFAERYHELDEYAKLRGKSEDVFRDQFLSDVGLNEKGGKTYDLGSQTVTARLQKDLSFLFELPSGKTAKSLPKKNADPEKFMKAKTDFDEMRKSVKRIVKYRCDRLFEDFLSGDDRAAEDWKAAYLKNPLLRSVAELIVWEQEGNTFILSGMESIDREGQPYRITDAMIKVAHPMEMNRDATKAWQKYFSKNGLRQPFLQVWEPVIDSRTIQEDRYEGCILPMGRFAGKEKHGIYSCNLHDYSEETGFSLEGCELDYDYSGRFRKSVDETYTLGGFYFEQYTRQVNHIVSLLDSWTIEDRIKKDDVSVADQLDSFTLAQITAFTKLAHETNAISVLALLMEYKNAHFAEFDPMEEFTLDLI